MATKTLKDIVKGFRPQFGNVNHIEALEVIKQAEVLERRVIRAAEAEREAKAAKKDLALCLGRLEALIQ